VSADVTSHTTGNATGIGRENGHSPSEVVWGALTDEYHPESEAKNPKTLAQNSILKSRHIPQFGTDGY
jgi:hypothetical protein